MNVPAPHNEKQTTTIASFSIRLTDELRLCRLNFSHECCAKRRR